MKRFVYFFFKLKRCLAIRNIVTIRKNDRRSRSFRSKQDISTLIVFRQAYSSSYQLLTFYFLFCYWFAWSRFANYFLLDMCTGQVLLFSKNAMQSMCKIFWFQWFIPCCSHLINCSTQEFSSAYFRSNLPLWSEDICFAKNENVKRCINKELFSWHFFFVWPIFINQNLKDENCSLSCDSLLSHSQLWFGNVVWPKV